MAIKLLGAAPAAATDAATMGYVDGRFTLTSNSYTTNFTAAPNSANRVDCYAFSTDIICTLPTAPAPGTVVSIYRYDSITSGQAYVLYVGTAGGDVFPWGFSDISMTSNSFVTLVYRGQWYIMAGGPDWITNSSGFQQPTSGVLYNAIMSRDGSGRVQVADPSVAADVATKNYVDTHTGTPPGDQLLLAACFR